jgi:hypothetical protein
MLAITEVRCFIVENLMIFLTLPRLPGTLAIFGAGKAAALLSNIPWLRNCRNYYWGDIDDAGYRILSTLRSSGLEVESVLMDQETWARFRHLAHPGSVELGSQDLNLLQGEAGAWRCARNEQLMLEQELLPQNYIESFLRSFFSTRA